MKNREVFGVIVDCMALPNSRRQIYRSRNVASFAEVISEIVGHSGTKRNRNLICRLS